jgi:hypothetical protein
VPVCRTILAWLCLLVGVILCPTDAFAANIMTPGQALIVPNGGIGNTTVAPTALSNASTVTVPALTGIGNNFTLSTTTAVGAVTISNPTSFTVGQVVNFVLLQDATGGEAITFGSDYNFTAGTPYFNTAANAKNVVSCIADTSSTLQCSATYINALSVGITPMPGGRISDNTSSCAHQTDSTTITTLYYLPCVGNALPISPNDATFLTYAIPSTSTSLSTANSTNFPANGLFDFYAFIHSGAVTYCAVKWGTSTAGASSRGGSAGITTLLGLTVNSGAWTCLNGATSYTLTTGEATLLGSFVISPTAQDVAVQFVPTAAAGGPTNGCYIGYANIYNSQPATCLAHDNTSSWTYGTATWQALDAGATGSGLYNRVYWVDPLGANNIQAALTIAMKNTTAIDLGAVGIGVNATSTLSGNYAVTGAVSTAQMGTAIYEGGAPQTGGGLNYVQAMQYANATATVTYYGTGAGGPTGQTEQLSLGVAY